jgi:ATP-dependent RNA helicase DDX55/SPB4
LAEQIYSVTKTFVDALQGLSILLLIGGTDVNEDMRNFRTNGGNIVIATPGRLNDIMNRMGPEFKVKELEVLVLDEADRLLDMGFHATITNILAKLPKQRRTVRQLKICDFCSYRGLKVTELVLLWVQGLFSATQTKEVSELVKAGMRNPVKVSIKVEDKKEHKVQAIPSTFVSLN